MKKKLIVTCIAAASLSACQSGQILSAGEKLKEAEQALCPLQTAQNLDRTLDNILELVPIIVWEPVCPTE